MKKTKTFIAKYEQTAEEIANDIKESLITACDMGLIEEIEWLYDEDAESKILKALNDGVAQTHTEAILDAIRDADGEDDLSIRVLLVSSYSANEIDIITEKQLDNIINHY